MSFIFADHLTALMCPEAVLELQRRVVMNERLLAAKDNEIKALREQVELQKG